MRSLCRAFATGAVASAGVVVGMAVGYWLVFEAPALVGEIVAEKIGRDAMVDADDLFARARGLRSVPRGE